MTLSPGSKLGPYEIAAPLGAGGMGEVYRARDTRLGRDVAIKVLPEHLAATPEVRTRFEREAKAISSLNHPHICTLHDVGHQDGVDYLVMELVEGETVAERIARGPLSTDEVLRYGIQIADALDKAHRQGLVHRDLKPGNVMLTKSGAKLLDFGLARATGLAPTVTDLTSSPTVSRPLTAEGTIVGTFQYMAPEQLEGAEADARSDLWALGVLLFEMSTGRKAFEGKSQASLIGSIMNTEPPSVSSIVTMAPPALDRVIHGCLAKDPEERIQTAHDVKLQLQWIAEGGSQAGVPAPLAARRRSRERTAWIAAGVAAIAAVAFAATTFTLWRKPARVIRFEMRAPSGVVGMGSPRISPDGQYIMFDAADSSGRSMLWLRPLDALNATPLAGTEGTGRAFWSPDSRHIAFFAGGKLRKIAVAGGPPQTICDAPRGSDGAWGRSGTILFDGRDGDSILAVSASGGVAAAATRLDHAHGELTHGWPLFMPDGRHFLYLAYPLQGDSVLLKTGVLGSDRTTVLGLGGSRLEYCPPGYLLFAREGTLMARPFDPKGLKFRGEPFPVSDQVTETGYGLAYLSVSQNGTLIYRGDASVQGRLVWYDRTGRELETVGESNDYFNLALSPDGKRIALRIREPRTNNRDIWILDPSRGTSTRFTFDPGADNFPIWSPDGSRIVYSSREAPDLYWKGASGTEEEQLLLQSPEAKMATDWSPDGRQILYQTFIPEKQWDLYVVSTEGDHKPVPLVSTQFNEVAGRFSPDGRWIAYASDESGRPEIYVRAMTGGGRWQISTQGGTEPIWRGDGRELFYAAPDQKIMGVEVRAAESFEAGIPKQILDKPMFPSDATSRRYAVTRDGEKFLLVMPGGRELLSPVSVVVNWAQALRKK